MIEILTASAQFHSGFGAYPRRFGVRRPVMDPVALAAGALWAMTRRREHRGQTFPFRLLSARTQPSR